VAAYHVVWECVVEQWLGVRRTTLRGRLFGHSLSSVSEDKAT